MKKNDFPVRLFGDLHPGAHGNSLRARSAAQQLALSCLLGICLPWLLAATPIAAGQQTSAGVTAEQSVQSIAAEYGLNRQERLTLQPVINELLYYYRARQVLSRRIIAHQDSFDRKLKALLDSKRHVLDSGRDSIVKENQFAEGLFTMRESFATGNVFDPKAADKGSHTPPWGWVLLRALPDMKKEVWARNAKRMQEWEDGDASFVFTWPGSSRETGKTLETRIQREQQALFDLRQDDGSYSIPFPYMNWITRERIFAYIEVVKDRLLKHRDQIRGGTLVMSAGDRPGQIYLVGPSRMETNDLQGWVTQERIRQRIAALESQKAAVLKQSREKSLRIHLSHIGWSTQGELEASMAEIVKKGAEVGRTLQQGDYKMFLPGPEKWYSLNSVDEEINKLRDRIKAIRDNANYSVPVLGFGPLTREGIRNALLRKGLTGEQRVNLNRANLPGAQNLEAGYYDVHMRHLQNLVFYSNMSESPFPWSHTGGAYPLLSHYRWDLAERKALIPEFAAERNQHVLYFDLRLNHLKECLALL